MWLVPLCLMAQTEQKYLAGAVPEVDGKVVFSQEFNVPSHTAGQIYDVLLAWGNTRFKDENNRVAYSDREKGEIAALGRDHLVFSSSALSLDRSLMSYRLILECHDNRCVASVMGIRYEYNVSYQREPEKYTAEEWITDKEAVNKEKLNRHNGKFRMKTIDYVEDLYKDIQAALGASMATMPSQTVARAEPVKTESATTEPAKAEPGKTEPVAAVTESQPSSLEGYRQITADKIPGNIVKMLSEDWMLITAGDDSGFNMMTASWGGLGFLLGKPVAFCFINPARYTYQLMEKNDTFTLTFYTEAYREALQYCGTKSGRDEDKVKGSGLTPLTTPSGSKAFREAWMIIECRKLISQPLSTESISNEEVRKEWIGRQVNKMYAGEIINVWVK